VLLDALADYGGTLIFVSHDRATFVDKLGDQGDRGRGGEALVYPGGYRGLPLLKKETAEDGVRRPRPASKGPRPTAGRTPRTRA
jgi:hypothetical protein